jgi:hypothetical protein
MSIRSRPVWVQVPATLILTGCASVIGIGFNNAVQSNPGSVVGVWAGALAAPLALLVTIALWRSGANSVWSIPVATVVMYLGAGLLARVFVHESWSSVASCAVAARRAIRHHRGE